MHIYLKIKAKELAAEAKFNKLEQRKALKAARFARHMGKERTYAYRMKQYHGMRDHLRTIVRDEARYTNIARGFLAGQEYKDIEAWTYKEPDWLRIWAMVSIYGEENPKHNQTILERWEEWYYHAKALVDHFAQLSDADRKKLIRKHIPLKPKVKYTEEQKEQFHKNTKCYQESLKNSKWLLDNSTAS